jgi:hypothetical protein
MHLVRINTVLVLLTLGAVFGGGRFAPSNVLAAAPVLVLTNQTATNKFGQYATEILRGEGLVAFDERDRASWSADPNAGAILAGYSAVLMSEMNLTTSEQQLLRNYVQGGGALIAARPDAGLSDVFGIQLAGDQPESMHQYFGVDPQYRPGQGITHGGLQYHGVASTYNLQGASALAHLYANRTTPTTNPAVTLHNFGQGKAVAFAFDPAKSVVLTRQGNPNWQNSEGDGLSQYRPHDFFARANGRTWYDPSVISIPHADELQRFLANVLIETNEAPLPRMWYLPENHKTLMINTGDGEDDFGDRFDAILNDAASYGGKFSLYLRDVGVSYTTADKEAEWRAAGHEVGVHVFAGGAEGAGAVGALTIAYNNLVGSLQNKFGHGARTARSHTIDWTGWVDMARIEANAGTSLDTNFYHYLNSSVVNPISANGYFTGSGLPQRFIDENGDVLDIYQAATQWPDEWFADNGMTAQQAFNIMKSMFENAESNGYYSTFVNNIHPVRYNGSDDITATWANAIWAYAQAEGIPMWSADMLLDFTNARNDSQFLNITHTENELEFDFIAGSAASYDLTIMIPALWQDTEVHTITVDGTPIVWSLEEIKGLPYAMFTTQSVQAHIVASYGVAAEGDFNGDGNIDAADYVVWRKHGGTDTAYDKWKVNFGSRANAGASSYTTVPELFSFWPPILGAMMTSIRRRSREFDRRTAQVGRRAPRHP